MTNPKRKEPKTIKNDTVVELDKILKEAETITLESLDFNKTFKEQGKILCEIKHMLSKNNRNNDNKPFTCNPVISKKLDDTAFNELFQKFKQKNIIATSAHLKSSRIGNKSSKKQSSSNSTLSVRTKSKSLKISKSKKTSKPSRTSVNKTKYKLNTRYPIVIIKKRTPRKNVIYLNK